MTSRRFQIGSATLSANDPQLAPTLADAHARRIRPLCLCRAPAAPLYVARAAGQFIPKRMHLPEFSFLLREGLHRRMTARFDRELTLWNAVAGAHLLVIATFGVGSGGVPEVEELALMVVTGTWIPIEHIYDSQLVDALTRNGRRFIKGLRYNLASSRPLAATVLSDAHPSPFALYIVPPGAGPNDRSALDELVAESSLPAWIWTAGESPMPALPQQERIGSPRG